MSDQNDCLIDLKVKETDFLTFHSHGVEYSYKYKNFKSNFRRNVEKFINDTLTKVMRECNDSVNIGSNSWIDGIDCELLQDGLEKKGKIRLKVTIEFVPDDIDKDSLIEGRSPLDDIRQINL
jgi:hypothetical protein